VVVSVQFFGAQRALTKTSTLQIPLTHNGRVSDVFQYLMDFYPNLPLREEDVLVTVNNNTTNMNHALNADDKIVFLPHVGGG
jgi:molybdopterin converting factor small subunit